MCVLTPLFREFVEKAIILIKLPYDTKQELMKALRLCSAFNLLIYLQSKKIPGVNFLVVLSLRFL
jgi:hypothetical protein